MEGFHHEEDYRVATPRNAEVREPAYSDHPRLL
jgi:hypothetical protein